MGSEKRSPVPALKDRLHREFYRFSFFQAVSLLEGLSPDRKPLGTTLVPGEEAVRFSSKTGLSFPASDISGLTHRDTQPAEMEIAFMGFTGPSGVLPHCFSEQVIERAQKKDHGLKAFYDMFLHRLISLFYLAWKKHHLSAGYLSDAKDKTSSYFLSLTGLGTGGLLEAIGLPDRSLPYFCSGLLSRGTPSVLSIEAAAGYLSGTAVRVEQFVEQQHLINREDRTSIGMANGELGVNTFCGTYVSDRQSKFRVHLGPMAYHQYIRFMPGGEMLRAIFSLIKYMVGLEYDFEVRLYLKRDEVPMCTLGEGHPLLGETTWVKSFGVSHEHDPFATFQETAV
jgi:type VI secretion system protein ImpH